MTIHGSLFTEFKEKDTQDPFSLQNKKLLRIDMRYGEVMAKSGSMVAYQGDVRFTKQGSGIGRMPRTPDSMARTASRTRDSTSKASSNLLT